MTTDTDSGKSENSAGLYTGIPLPDSGSGTDVTGPADLPDRDAVLARLNLALRDVTGPVQIPGAPPGYTVRAVWVTPEMAAAWLELTEIANRHRRGYQSDLYSRDMAAGRWMFNGEPVVFDTEGNVMQGQHRLEGVVKGGVPVLLLLVEGIDPAVMPTYDTGLPRYYHDMLAVAGYSYTSCTAAVTRAMWYWDRGRAMMNAGSGERPSRPELDSYLQDHHDEVTGAASYAEKVRGDIPLPPSVNGTVRIILDRVDAGAAEVFLDQLASGLGMEEGSPVAALHRTLFKIKAVHPYSRKQRSLDERRALVFGAWNLWRDGRQIQKLQPWRGPLTMKNFPRPR